MTDAKIEMTALGASDSKHAPLADGSYPSRFVEFFGPSMWKTLHAVSFTFPLKPTDEDRENYKTFFNSVGPVVPCPSCSTHYRQYVANVPPNTESRETLTRWLYDLHAVANKDGNKVTPSFEEVQRRYSGWSKADNEAFHGLNRRYRLKRMADPHFDKLPGAITQSPLEDLSTRNAIGVAVLILVIIAIILGAYIWYRRNQEFRRKTKAAPEVPAGVP